MFWSIGGNLDTMDKIYRSDSVNHHHADAGSLQTLATTDFYSRRFLAIYRIFRALRLLGTFSLKSYTHLIRGLPLALEPGFLPVRLMFPEPVFVSHNPGN